MLPDDIVNKLNNLIQINLDASKGFKEAGTAVSDADLQKVFNASSVDRQNFANLLKRHVNRHGEEPETESSIKSSLHRTWMTFKADVTTNNEETIIEECIRGEEAALEAYEEVIPGNALTPTMSDIIMTQHKNIKQSIQQLKEWKTILEARITS